MSEYSVIAAVSSTLKELLNENVTLSSDSQLNGVQIQLLSPKEMEQAGLTSGISVWLYKVARMAEMLNEPPERRGAILQGTLKGTSEQLRIALEALTVEELSLVWEALSEPYELSVTYLVQVV